MTKIIDEIRGVAADHGHTLGRDFDDDGVCQCIGCGAAMVDDDAFAFLYRGETDALGSFARWCPDPQAGLRCAHGYPDGGEGCSDCDPVGSARRAS